MVKKDENNKKIRTENLDDWWDQIDVKDMVVFEQYLNTIARCENKVKEEEETWSEDEEIPQMIMKNIAVFNTPFGPAKLPEFSDITKHFKLWTMYTKVPLNDQMCRAIDTTYGVETFEVLSPYRAHIGIAPLFKDGTVLQNVKLAVEKFSEEKKQKLLNSVYSSKKIKKS